MRNTTFRVSVDTFNLNWSFDDIWRTAISHNIEYFIGGTVTEDNNNFYITISVMNIVTGGFVMGISEIIPKNNQTRGLLN